MKIKSTIVIATCSRSENLKRCLTSLAGCSFSKGIVRVLVIENGEKCDAETICNESSLPVPLLYFYLHKPGQSSARKFSMTLIDSDDLVIFFDDDIRFSTSIIDAYICAASTYGHSNFYGGPVLPEYETEPNRCLIDYYPFSIKGFSPFSRVTFIDEPIFLGANWAAFASDIISVGNFNPALGPGGSSRITGHETELQGRLLQAGLRGVYLPDAVVWHFVPKESLSFDWLKSRYFKMGGSHAMNLSARHCKNYIGPVPRWFLRDFFKSTIDLCWSIIKKRNCKHTYALKLIFYKNLGAITYFFRNKRKN